MKPNLSGVISLASHGWRVFDPAQEVSRSITEAVFVLVGKDRTDRMRPVGIGFFIAHFESVSIGVSAKHVVDGALQIQEEGRARPRPLPGLEMFFGPPVELRRESLHALLLNRSEGASYNVVKVCAPDETDLALLVMTSDTPQSSFRLALHTQPPFLGERLISLAHQVETKEIDSTEIDAIPMGSTVLHQRVSVREGIVKNIYPRGVRHYCFPCFGMTTPFLSGMSGCPVVRLIRTQTGLVPAVCGIVTGSFEDDKTDRWVERSTVSSLWPIVAFPTYLKLVQAGEDESTPSVLDLIKRNLVEDYGDSPSKTMIEVKAQGSIQMRRVDTFQ